MVQVFPDLQLAVSALKTAQSTFCNTGCSLSLVGCSSSNTTADKACGIICCPNLGGSTEGAGNTCAGYLNGKYGDSTFPATCSSDSEVREIE